MASPTDTRTALPVWTGTGTDYTIRFTDDAGQERTWNARYNPQAQSGQRDWSIAGWWTWPDYWDDVWEGELLFLAGRRADAQDEFLLLVVHGWTRAHGYVDGDVNRPIYGKGKVRRERAFIVAELTGGGVCATCHRVMRLDDGGFLHRHGRHKAKCPGSHRSPADEPALEAS